MASSGDKQHQELLQAARTHDLNHEKDERWTAVDKYALKHLYVNSPHFNAINQAIELSEEKGLPSIEVSLLQGKWLLAQCQMIDAKHCLEVGTLGGVSSICMALAGSDVKVTSIEIDPERKAVAEQATAQAGLSDRIEVLLGAGMDVLPKVRQEVEEGKRPKFDFVFIDADKPNNLNYFNEAMGMVRSRAVIIVDNVVRKGLLADDEEARTNVSIQGARKVIEAAGQDDRLSATTLLQTVGEKNCKFRRM